MVFNAKKFYTLFLGEIKKSGIESIPWNDSKEWTDRMMKNKNCNGKNGRKFRSFIL